jgi:hypothetical protein
VYYIMIMPTLTYLSIRNTRLLKRTMSSLHCLLKDAFLQHIPVTKMDNILGDRKTIKALAEEHAISLARRWIAISVTETIKF